jgi:hypothetical protein
MGGSVRGCSVVCLGIRYVYNSSGEGRKGVLICWCSARDARCVRLEGLGSEQRLRGFGTQNSHDRGRAG